MGSIRGTKTSGKRPIQSGATKIGRVTDEFLTANLNWWGTGADGSLDVGANAQNYNVSASVDDWIKVLYLTSLRVRSGYTLTTSNRCRGLAIYVDGDALIEGTLSMTARGAYTPNIGSEVGVNGLRIVRRKMGESQTLSASDVTGAGSAFMDAESSQPGINSNGKIYQIPRAGASGGVGHAQPTYYGSPGNTLTMSPGGGGAGGANMNGSIGGSGGSATCFCGGAGGGGKYGAYILPFDTAGYPGSSVGGAGGAGFESNCGGGAGNPGGAGVGAPNGASGIGGLLLLFVRGTLTVASSGVINSNGTIGGSNGYSSGGSSGGGLIMCLYGTGYSNSGTLQCNGGAQAGTQAQHGGAGGAGYVLVEQIDV